MLDRLAWILAIALTIGCFTATPALASKPSAEKARATAAVQTMLQFLSAVNSVRVGANSTVVTLQSGRKAHPIVIEYGDAVRAGPAKAKANGRAGAKSGASTAEALPRSFSLGQIAAVLLGLTIATRAATLLRRLRSARRRGV